MSRARRIARNTGLLVAGEALSKVASLALYVVMARELGATGFGDFMFALSLAVLLTVFGNFGIDSLVAREVARRHDAAEGLLADGVTTKLIFGGLGATVAAAIALAGDDETVAVAIVLLAVSAVVDMAAKVYQSTFQGLDDLAPVAAALLLQRTVTAAAGIALLVSGGGVALVALAYLGGALIAFSWIAARLARRGVRLRARTSPARVRALITASFAIGLAGIFSTVLFRIDATMLSAIDGNEAVGLYSAGYRLLESSLFLTFAFVAALLPSLSQLTRESTPPVAAVFELACKVIAVTLMPIGACFVAFAEPVVDVLYGPEFAPAVTTVRILGGAVVLYGFSYLGSYVLISQGRQRVLPWIVGGVTVLNIALNLVLIPARSFEGAAIATTVSEAVHASLMIGFAVWAAGAIDPVRIALGPVAGVAALFAVVALLGDGPAAIVAGLLAYVAVLAVVERSLFGEDLRLVVSTLRRKPALPGPVTR